MNERLRPAEPRGLWQIKAIVAASYEKYLTRMNKAPAPVGRDYEDAIQQGLVWVVGDPVVGLVSFATSETSLLIEMSRFTRQLKASVLDADSWSLPRRKRPIEASTELLSTPTKP